MWDDSLSNSSIPWSHPHSWQAAQQSIHHHTARLCSEQPSLLSLAHLIEARLQALTAQMEALCAHTCIHCPDPCCLKASVWYDFRDLLCLHLNGRSIPVGQPISGYRGVCRYISHRGCSLPRPIRPWICTWYLCTVQKRWLHKQPGEVQESIALDLEQIKTKRVALEEKFIAVVSGWKACDR